MSDSEQKVTMSFVGTVALHRLVTEWAKRDDRTVSATMRRILEAEAARRAAKEEGITNVPQPATQHA